MVTEQPWQAGLIDASSAAKVNLIIFSGGALESPHGFDSQRSKIFELAGPENIDGLIIGSDFLGHYVGAEKIKVFCDQYKPLPIVKHEPLVEGYPTLLFDFYQGMHDLVSHLIEVHHFTKIGYITGPEQSRSIKDRFQAYQDVLREHAIPFDENLVITGTISSPYGDEAIRIFLDESGLQPGVDLQAIVGFYDSIAIDTLIALQKRGIHIPNQIAIVGFDDDETAFATNPPLTTVRLPFYEIGRWGVDTLVTILEGKEPPAVTQMSASLVIRQSCGCVPRVLLPTEVKARDAAQSVSVNSAQSARALRQKRNQIIALLIRTAGIQNIPHFRQDIERLLDFFIEECEMHLAQTVSASFAEKLEGILGRMGSIHYNTEMLSAILSGLQSEILEISSDEEARSWVQSLFQQAHAIASDFIQRFLIGEKSQATYLDSLLHEINQEMATALSVQDLVEILWHDLPRLGIPACYLALYENLDKFHGYSRLMLAYDKNGRIQLDANGYHFHSKDLIPKWIRKQNKPSSLVVQPLFHREEQMGFVVFETGPRYGGLYEALREQISSALKRIQLHQKVVEARRAAEEANRLKSQFLSIVTHELRAPLSMIVSLSEMLLEDPEGNRPMHPDAYRQDIEVIHSTGQHLDRLLLDVLDLGRSQLGQLKINLKPLDLTELFREVQLMGEQMAKEKHLSWRVRVPKELPVVKGDRTRLRQILINLISNATKFTIRGEVSLLVTVGDSEVTVAISDTGFGIPLEDQKNIFDEFHQSERTAARGYGGMGLGLAITRRLVEMHGGKINCISSGEEGSGTTFYFTLPIQPEALPEDQDTEEIRPEESVLVISQDAPTAEQLSAYLENQGYLVTLADVGSNFLKLERTLSSPYSAIVIHSDPAAEWSQEVLRILQSHPEKQDFPILFYHLSPEQNQGAFLNLNLIPKPLGSDSFLRVLKQRGLTEISPSAPSQTVLVVDDETEILRLHAQMIREHLPNCCVLEALNGRQALDLMLAYRPDLVLLDLMMPELDGFGVLEVMQTHQTLRAVPVIIMTSQVLSEDTILRLNRCVTSILSKGLFSVEETLKQIESSLARDKRLGSEPQRIARRTMAFIHTKYAEPISRSDIASYIGVNERYLTHCFRQEVGITPMEYLNRYRVKIARQLLETECKSITEIGLEAGFYSSAHFSRVFHQYMGISPREYQRTK
jgi:signal transduction histidine kinase/DNA-binding LacI/PurR family transcriptional regulator/AraC-like DNA-binding protein/ActR/RegA family two-component response regulator